MRKRLLVLGAILALAAMPLVALATGSGSSASAIGRSGFWLCSTSSGLEWSPVNLSSATFCLNQGASSPYILAGQLPQQWAAYSSATWSYDGLMLAAFALVIAALVVVLPAWRLTICGSAVVIVLWSVMWQSLYFPTFVPSTGFFVERVWELLRGPVLDIPCLGLFTAQFALFMLAFKAKGLAVAFFRSLAIGSVVLSALPVLVYFSIESQFTVHFIDGYTNTWLGLITNQMLLAACIIMFGVGVAALKLSE